MPTVTLQRHTYQRNEQSFAAEWTQMRPIIKPPMIFIMPIVPPSPPLFIPIILPPNPPLIPPVSPTPAPVVPVLPPVITVIPVVPVLPPVLAYVPVIVPVPAVPAQALYLTEAGDTNAISVNDIHQDGIGDCFLVSQMGELAMLKPSFISNMIQANSNGTETVTLYSPTYTGIKAVKEIVTNTFASDSVNSGATQDVVGKTKEIWAQVIEKAVSMLDGGYNNLNGGSPTFAMEQLTGQAASAMTPGVANFAFLTAAANAGDMITMDTIPNGKLTNGLVTNHCYMFEGMTGSSSATAVVHLGNPWGTDQPTGTILLSQLSNNFREVDIGHV